MRTATRIAEGFSFIVLLLMTIRNPHGEMFVYLINGAQAAAALFVTSVFPNRRSPVVAIVLAVVVLLANFRDALADSGGAGLHSPIMGIGALIFLALFAAQIVAAIGAVMALRKPKSA